MPRKKTRAIDSSGDIVEVYTLQQAAKYLGITKNEIKLQMFASHTLKYYKVSGLAGTKLIRLTKKDLDNFVKDKGLYDKIADKIALARNETVVLRKGISQTQMAKDLRCTRDWVNKVENKKQRVGFKMLQKIALVTDKPFDWFFS